MGSSSSPKDHMVLSRAHTPAKVLFSVDFFGGQSEYPQRLTAAVKLLLGDTLAMSPMVVVALGTCYQPLCCPVHSSFGLEVACPPVGERGFKSLEVPVSWWAQSVNLGVLFCLGDLGGNCVGALIWELGAILPLLVSLTHVLHGETSSFTSVSLSSGSKHEHVTSGRVGCCSYEEHSGTFKARRKNCGQWHGN